MLLEITPYCSTDFTKEHSKTINTDRIVSIEGVNGRGEKIRPGFSLLIMENASANCFIDEMTVSKIKQIMK